MRLISWLIALPLTVLVISFAASNLGTVDISLWPVIFDAEIPMVAFAFCVLLVGFFLGAMTTWISAGKTRSRARQAERRSQQQAREISSLEEKVQAGDANPAQSLEAPRPTDTKA